MASSFSDYIVSKDCSKKPRYIFKRGECSWCKRQLWLPAEGICGACYEDPKRIAIEKARIQSEKTRKEGK